MAVATPTDAVALLKADHRKVEDLFAKFKAAKGAEKKQRLVTEICTELTIHTIIEEEIFIRLQGRGRRGHDRGSLCRA
jgi:hemerythrin superfamily protein